MLIHKNNNKISLTDPKLLNGLVNVILFSELKEHFLKLLNIRDGHFWQILISIIDRFQKQLIEYSWGGACARHDVNGDNANI